MIAAGTIAVSAPAPPMTPRNHAGKLFRASISSDMSPFASPGTISSAAKPAIRMKTRLRV
jgi:hypothetical protein